MNANRTKELYGWSLTEKEKRTTLVKKSMTLEPPGIKGSRKPKEDMLSHNGGVKVTEQNLKESKALAMNRIRWLLFVDTLCSATNQRISVNK